jgi:DNA-binding XRE family transcriptional regulator
MVYLRIVHSPALLSEAQHALGLTQETLGVRLGVSRRTMGRWVAGDNGPTIQQWADLAGHVHASDPALAARIAEEMGESLVSLGIVPPAPPAAAAALPAGPPPRPAIPMSDLVDSIVCAAAEATATTPQSIRPALLAAFDRAASVSLTVDDVRATLRPAGAATDRSDAKKKRAP